jgi:methionine--tRNA ligase beta chain
MSDSVVAVFPVGLGRGKGSETKAKTEAKTEANPVTVAPVAAKTKTEAPAAAKAAVAEVTAPEKDEDLDPSKLDIRVGLVTKCWAHPESDKLLCEEIDLGEGAVRQIASGLRPHYGPQEFEGRKVLVLSNLKERSIGGFKSNGMVLCACNDDHTVVKLLQPPAAAAIGERVVFIGFKGEPATPSVMAKKKVLEKLAPGLKTDATGKAKWGDGAYFTLESGIVSADGQLADAPIS